MEACGETCLADLQSQKCESCKGTCITLSLNPFLGRHDPLYDRLLTMQLKNTTKRGAFHPTTPRSSASLVESGKQAHSTGTHHQHKVTKGRHHHEVSVKR